MIVHNSNRLLTESQYRFPVGDVENVISVPGIRAHFHAFALQIKGHEDLRFEFWKQASRDEVSHFWGNSRTDAIKRLWHTSNHWLERIQSLQLSVQDPHRPERQTVESNPLKCILPTSLPPQKALYLNHCL